MSDTVETDIQRVFTIANEILPRYEMPPLSFAELRKIADGPFDLFLIPLIFSKEYREGSLSMFNEARRVEIRGHALEIARKHGFDVDPPDFIQGIEQSLRETKEAGLRNVLITTGGRRYKHQAMEKAGIGGYFEEIVDRDETYYAKEQGSTIFTANTNSHDSGSSLSPVRQITSAPATIRTAAKLATPIWKL